MQPRPIPVEVVAEKIRREFDGDESMAVNRPAPRLQGTDAADIKPRRPRPQFHAFIAGGHVSLASKVQADLDAPGVKAATPVHVAVRFQLMPLEAESVAPEAASQLTPFGADRRPDSILAQPGLRWRTHRNGSVHSS